MSEKIFINSSELAQSLGVSKSYAYRLINQLNGELAKKGYIVFPGKVSKQYVNERFYGAVAKDV